MGKRWKTMMTRTMTRSQIKHMSADERMRHYQQEKDDLFYRMRNMTAQEVRDAHEALREKWRV